MTARALVGSLLLPVVLVLTGCSGSVSVGSKDPTVDRADVEKQVSTELGNEVGREPDSVTCPGDLTGKVGETMRCSLTDGETELGVTVTVTTVKGTDVEFDIQVDDAATPSP